MSRALSSPLIAVFFATGILFPWGQTNPVEPLAYAPFIIGERLVYKVEWNPPWYLFFFPAVDAGEATISLEGLTRYQGRRALKIVLSVRSSGTLAKLAGVKVDDRYEFLTDPDTFCTFCATMRVRQGKRLRDIDVSYLPENARLHFREVDVSTNPPRVLNDKYKEGIPPCVKDGISVLYSLRRSDFKVGTVERQLVGDTDKVNEVEIQVEKEESVRTQMGVYNAWKINTVGLLGGLFRNPGQFRIWLSADEKKIPVRFEVKTSLGKVTGSLRTVHF
jgi:hypothetical protein